MARDPVGTEHQAEGVAALELLLDLLDVHPELECSAPPMQSVKGGKWAVVPRSAATAIMRDMVGIVGRDPRELAMHSGRNGDATQLAKQEAFFVIQIQRAGR